MQKFFLIFFVVISASFSKVNDPCSSETGICINTGTCNKYNGKIYTGKCPDDPENVKCCYDISCKADDGRIGSCKFVDQCKGDTVSGKCPGGANFKCCFDFLDSPIVGSSINIYFTSYKIISSISEIKDSTSKIDFTNQNSQSEIEERIDISTKNELSTVYITTNTKSYSSEFVIEQSFSNLLDLRQCFERCETCNELGNITNMNCLSCKLSLLENQSMEHLIITEQCDSIEEFQKYLFLTPNGNCELICPDNTYEFFENKTCLYFCPNGYEKNEEQKKCIKKIKSTTSSEFKNQIMKNISEFISTENSSKIINGSDFIALISPSNDMTPQEQIKKGISAIDLGNCTNTIKEYYNISQNESFYVLTIESKKNETEKTGENNDKSFNLGKEVQIKIYDKSGNKLDLSICKEDIKVMKYIGDANELNIDSAKSFSEQGIDVFNVNDDFFNDICQDFNNIDGKDIIINDRRTDIYQNATFCQKGCSYYGINYELMAANCICDSSLLKITSDNNGTYNENKNNEEEILTFKSLTKSIIANLFDFNTDVIKCYNLVFNINIFYKNIGFYCMILMFILQIIFLFVYIVKGLKPIKLYMLIFNSHNAKSMKSFPPLKKKKKIKNNFSGDIKNKNNKENISKKSKIKLDHVGNIKKSEIPHPKVSEESKIILQNNYSSNINIQIPIININNQNHVNKKRLQNGILLETFKIKNKLYKIKPNKKVSYYNLGNQIIKSNKKVKFLYNIETTKENNKNNIKLLKYNVLNKLPNGYDDLQNLSYEQAIIFDKRTYFRMYWAFLVEAQIILETFCKKDYLNLFVIKLSFFIFTFQINFFLNAFFYTDEYISNAYHNNGVLDFFSSLPKSIYSLIATMVITNFLNMFSNSRNELNLAIRKKREDKNYLNIINIILKKLRNKLIIYFILIFILGIIFLYYVSAFCSVYYYSQKYWFIGCLESFGIDYLIAIVICIFLAFFRYLSIKKHIKCFYILANIISAFL